MSPTSWREIASPSPAPSKRRACEPSPCSKLSKIAARRSAGTPGPVSITENRAASPSPRSTVTQTPPALGELDRVAGEIGEHLAQAQAVGAHEARRGGADRGGDFDALALRARREQFDHALDQLAQIDRLDDQFEMARLDLGEIEDFVDERDQRAPRAANGLDVARVLGIERGLPQQVGHAEDAADRRADFVAHGRQKARFGLVRRLGPIARGGRFLEPPEFVAQAPRSRRPLQAARASV